MDLGWAISLGWRGGESEGGGEAWYSLFLTAGQICQAPCSLMVTYYRQEAFPLYYFIEPFHSKKCFSHLKTGHEFLTFLPLKDMGFVFPPLETELTCDCSDLCSVVGMTLWLLSLGPQRPRAWVS